MSIKGNNSSGLISATAVDFTILQNTSTTRWSVNSISLHDYGGVGDTVELFVSADAVSAAAERIDKIVVAIDETDPGLFIPFNLAAGQFLVGKAVTGATVNVNAIYTIYTGDS